MTLGDRLSKRVRLLGAGLAAVGASSLSGCGSSSTENGGGDGQNGDGGGTDDAGQTGGSTTTAPASTAPSTTPRATTTGPRTSSGGSGATSRPGASEDCSQRERELKEKIFAVENEIRDVDFLLDDQRTNERAMELFVDQLSQGFSDATMQRAKSVGLAARESVVVVEGYKDGRMFGGGTGWFVDEGTIVTNAHVVDDYRAPIDYATCYLPDGTEFRADVVDYYSQHQPDMALLETDYTDAPSLPLGSETTLSEGQPLVQVGHPSGIGSWVICLGKFVARDEILLRDRKYTDIKTLVQGLQGVSGSPVLDLNGDVVGLTWGGGPPWQREMGEHPEVAPDVVYDVQYSPVGVSKHLGAEGIAEALDEW